MSSKKRLRTERLEERCLMTGEVNGYFGHTAALVADINPVSDWAVRDHEPFGDQVAYVILDSDQTPQLWTINSKSSSKLGAISGQAMVPYAERSLRQTSDLEAAVRLPKN